MRQSGVTVAWRGTPSLDDWVAYIVNGTKSRKLILADHTSERKVKALLARINGLSKKEVEKLAMPAANLRILHEMRRTGKPLALVSR